MSPSCGNEYLHGPPPTPTAPGHSGDVFFSVLQRGPIIPLLHCQLPPHHWAISTGYTHASNFQPSNWHRTNHFLCLISLLSSPASPDCCLYSLSPLPHLHSPTLSNLALSPCFTETSLVRATSCPWEQIQRTLPSPHQCCSRLSVPSVEAPSSLHFPSPYPIHPVSSRCVSFPTCVLTPFGAPCFLPNTQHCTPAGLALGPLFFPVHILFLGDHIWSHGFKSFLFTKDSKRTSLALANPMFVCPAAPLKFPPGGLGGI